MLHRWQVHLRGNEEEGPRVLRGRALGMQEIVVEGGSGEHVAAAMRVPSVPFCGLASLGEDRPRRELVVIGYNVVQEGVPLTAHVRKGKAALNALIRATFAVHGPHFLELLAPRHILVELRQHHLQLIFAYLTPLEAGELLDLGSGERAPPGGRDGRRGGGGEGEEEEGDWPAGATLRHRSVAKKTKRKKRKRTGKGGGRPQPRNRGARR
mmetsp:Transcript_25253/g.63438  ORF Transcript_25253/g.63438 Transcript_25253/m.63438 type:complete len:210 (+) Transcript_25253:442-1071(+)